MVVTDEYENQGDLRGQMVTDQLMRRGIHNPAILNAFREIPRHLFVSNHQPEDAYSDQPLPIKCGQTISQPYIVALMLSYLDIPRGAHILEIGSGSGYATALMSKMCSHICAIEVYHELIDDSLRVLSTLQISNFEMHHASAWEQLNGGIVYDRIILWASPPRIPEHLFEYLKEGGILVAPEGKSEQYVWICTKKDGKMIKQRKDPVRFVPLVQGSIQEIDRKVGGKHE
ncbi:MAG: protein-L-isoaspartate(D-aspartate) O-methyltransferase [Candidatus Marinimicrobia bacterium]|nr:protein-L-isoaspartate(D-aspartate) O-methyltransferase [Candidatus Neomarinimicrobiota bacterium]MCF7922417.1 protein-L-isoaspartate(D-aspartate) O-methyltransferase [Candidatus Neomarinimicrobiota bacterium]